MTDRRTTKDRLSNILWWLGVPLFAAIVTWAPYLIRNFLLGRADWFRIPLVGDAVFDVAAYLQPVGHAALGIPEAVLIGPFASLVSALAALFPDATIAELWLITRWLSAVTAIWIGAWAVKRWTGLDQKWTRLISVTLWIALALVLGMKPGVFSWFLPLGLVGFACIPIVSERLRERRVVSAVFWSVLIFIATSVYAWYQLFLIPWLGVVWFRWFASRSIKISSAFYALGSLCSIAIGLAGAYWINATEQGTILLQLYERLSLSETHMIFLSSSVVLTVLWIMLLVPVMQRMDIRSMNGRFADMAFSAWITLLLIFFHSPFTGHYIQNDHFRSPAAIASWLTLALLWKLSKDELTSVRARKYERFLILIPLLISAIYVVKIIAAPYAWNGDLLNDLHLTHWFALLLGSWIVWRWTGNKRPLRPMTFAVLVGGSALLIGGTAWTVALVREFKGMPPVERLQPLIAWIEQNVPADASLCADHGGDGYSLDDQLSAITGRVIHFAHTTLYHKEPSIAYLNRMRTVAGFYDVRGAGDEYYWQLHSSLNQFIVCAQFPWQTRLFRAMGFDEKKANELIGCPQNVLDARWAYVSSAMDGSSKDENALKEICPFVVIPDRTRPFWHLPESYREERVMEGVSVFVAE